MSVQEILDRKGDRVITASYRSALPHISKILSRENIGAVMLTDEDGRLVGIVSERDIIRVAAQNGGNVANLTADTVMVRNLITCTLRTSVSDVLTMMSENVIRHLPVTSDDELVGLISVRDVLDFQRLLLKVHVDRREQDAQALQEAYDTLEAAFNERAEDIQIARREAENANRIKTEFLATMSHEIRTPMNGILGMLRLLKGTDLTPKQQNYVDKTENSGEALLGILNEVLDISKIEAGGVELEEVAFVASEICESVTALMEPRAVHAGLTFDVGITDDVPQVLIGDPARIRQVLINLVGNAIKFTSSGGIRVAVSHTQLSQDKIKFRFDVADTGLGISKDAQQKIFEKFTQADTSITRKFGGTGLGLSICKQLAELMRGDIGVQSVPGAGSTFWFTAMCGIGDQADLADKHATVEATEFWLPESGEQIRVLIAEDDRVNQEIAKDTLEQAGFCVDVVANGIEAIKAVQNFPYDLVLMDVHMPEMDGLTATRNIRQISDDFAEMPIVALTANAMGGDRDKFLAAGMTDYVSKPFDPHQLVSTIVSCVRNSAYDPNKALSPASREGTEIAPTAVLDPAVVEPLRAGKPDLWKKLIGIFLETTPAGLETLDQALTGDDCVSVQMTAHTLKSSSANMGAAKLSDLCRQLEAAAGDGNLETGFALFSQIRSEFDIVSAALVGDGDSDTKAESSAA